MADDLKEPQSPPQRAEVVRELVAAYAARLDRGETLDLSGALAAHPTLAPELEQELRKLALVHGAIAAADQRVAPAAGANASGDSTFVVTVGELTTTSPGAVRDAAGAGVPPDAIPGYELIREIHRGGQGIVYLAMQLATKRKVAVKVILEGRFAGAADRARFEREVQILAALKHPNIVAIHDSGSAGGCFYLVMDYIPGQTLDRYVESRRRELAESPSGGSASGAAAAPGKTASHAGSRVTRRAVDEFLRMFAKICDAVNAAHLRGVIHRDLKPSNIRVDPEGEPVVLDFGLAKAPVGDVAPAAAMTETGQFVGSLPWASPEQASGMPSAMDVRSDVYSLGVILFQMLTGRFPYDVTGSMRDVLDRIISAAPARPSTLLRHIGDEVETIVLKCLAKERERRYQNAGELASDIRRYLSGEAIEAKRDSAWYVLRKMARRNAVAAVMLMTLLVGIGSAGTVAVFYRVLAREGAEEAERARQAHAAAVNEFGELTEAQLSLALDYAFARFIDEYAVGRSDVAATLAQRWFSRRPGYSEAAAFLLDPSRTPEVLRAQMPCQLGWIAEWAVAERLRADGDHRAAVAAYEQMQRARPPSWAQTLVDSRRRELSAARGADGEADNRGP
ncbi:Serine/threonine-protein kinase PrkC [Phycisphaerae bacterium RAS1]|nr:Serine/threonine-protein kinase PrkC [Phycisphaerae bacterium RAS1]